MQQRKFKGLFKKLENIGPIILYSSNISSSEKSSISVELTASKEMILEIEFKGENIF